MNVVEGQNHRDNIQVAPGEKFRNDFMPSGHELCLNRCESLIVLDEIVIFIFLERPILVLINVFYNLSHPYGLMHAIVIVGKRRAALIKCLHLYGREIKLFLKTT